MTEAYSCHDCECQVASQTVTREGRHLTSVETVYTCGARKTEMSDTESSVGRVAFEGCHCAA